MNIDKYSEKAKNCYASIVEKVKINDASAQEEIEALLIRAFNDGVVAQMTASSKKVKSTGEMNEYLPEVFVESDVVKQMTELILKAIKAQTTNGMLNANYRIPLSSATKQIIKTIYMVGLNSGFEIASNNELKEMYLSDKERFVGTTE